MCKKINKPDIYIYIYQIPRGGLDLKPEIELTEEELRAKEKTNALQSLQQIFIDDINNVDNRKQINMQIWCMKKKKANK